MKKKLLSICLAVLMLLAMLPATALAAGGGNYGTQTTVDHIDIDVRLETTLMIDGKEVNVTFPNLTASDASLIQISGKYADGTAVEFTRSGVSTSTDGAGNRQIRIEGTFPIGTSTNPVKYTVSVTKDYTVDGVTIPVTLSATAGFWDSSNVCPGWGSSKGIDLKLGEGSADYGLITVQKTVAGAALAADKTFRFEIKDAAGAVIETVSVTVPAGQTTAATTVMVPFGTYTVVELADSAALDGYTVTIAYQTTGTGASDGTVAISSDQKNQTVSVTNTYAAEIVPVELSVKKVWDDADNRDGIRPASVEVQLLANGEAVEGKTAVLSADGDWSYTWTDLPDKDGSGNLITYSVGETAVAGYTASYENGILTNTHTPEVIPAITVTKAWNDAGNQDGIRPASVKVQLLADGKAVGDPVELTEAGQWTYTWTGLAKYADGREIVYTVEELDVPAGYTAAVDGMTITNTHTPADPEPVVETVDKTVTKVWNDADNQDGLRPASVKVQLLADGKAVGDPVELTEAGKWTYTWTGLAKYADGKEISYTFEEAAVEGYTAAYKGDTIVNTHTPGAVNVTVVKKWVDGNSKDRPTEVTVQLYANGKALGDPVKVTKDGGWSYVWKSLPACADGKEITYTAKELNVPVAYNATYSKDTLTITNTLKSIPKTGDSANLWLYGGIMAVCAAAAVVLLLTKKKRRA